MLVWGGLTGPSGSADAAAYRPADDRWHRLSDAPRRQTGGQGVWTGSFALGYHDVGSLMGSNADSFSLLIYNVATDQWTAHEDEHISQGHGVWTGTALVAIGIGRSDSRIAAWQWRP